jgi:hypothetical protein
VWYSSSSELRRPLTYWTNNFIFERFAKMSIDGILLLLFVLALDVVCSGANIWNWALSQPFDQSAYQDRRNHPRNIHQKLRSNLPAGATQTFVVSCFFDVHIVKMSDSGYWTWYRLHFSSRTTGVLRHSANFVLLRIWRSFALTD